MPCALGQLVDAGYLTLSGKGQLMDCLQPGSLVRAAEPLLGDRAGPERTLREQRPPTRLATVVREAARSGIVGIHTVAVVLGRDDDDQLFDEVMFGESSSGLR
jgi:hypothetical protein